MEYPINVIESSSFPPLLHETPHPPEKLFYRGNLPAPELKLIAVVGSRRYSSYGKQVVEHLIQGLRGYPIGIVSGMALGIDSLAHRAALENNLYTLAVPGSGLDDSVLYPRSHVRLAHHILEQGGCLMSEYEPTFTATHWTFPRRNRIVVGMCAATILIEAGEKSGTLISARLAADYNRELLVVPGNIFSTNSVGCHQFLKLGATPVTSAADILDVLHIDRNLITPTTSREYTETEHRVLQILREPTDRDTLIRMLALPTSEASVLLMHMEMSGYIRENNGIISRLENGL